MAGSDMTPFRPNKGNGSIATSVTFGMQRPFFLFLLLSTSTSQTRAGRPSIFSSPCFSSCLCPSPSACPCPSRVQLFSRPPQGDLLRANIPSTQSLQANGVTQETNHTYHSYAISTRSMLTSYMAYIYMSYAYHIHVYTYPVLHLTPPPLTR